MKLKIYRICKENPLPVQKNYNDAGYDVYSAENVEFKKDEIKLVSLGIIAQAPVGYHFKLCIRSSMAGKRGFTQPNAPGIIDHLYCGPNDEIKMLLKASRDSKISKGERVGQLLLEKNSNIEWDEQDNRYFEKNSRGGFGSTGE